MFNDLPPAADVTPVKAKWNGKTPIRAEIIERRKRVNQVEQLMERGISSDRELATLIGCHPKTITKYKEHILRGWVAAGPNKTKHKRALRVRQLEHVVVVATAAFAESKKEATEQTDQTRETPCMACGGLCVIRDPKGKQEDKKCKACAGKGVVTEKTRVVKRRGQAGDPAFLAVVHRCIAEINRLEGNYAPKRIDKRVQSVVAHVDLRSDGSYDPEKLLAAKVALEQLRGQASAVENAPPAIDAIEGQVVASVEVEPVEPVEAVAEAPEPIAQPIAQPEAQSTAEPPEPPKPPEFPAWADRLKREPVGPKGRPRLWRNKPPPVDG